MVYASEPVTPLPENDRSLVVDFLSESVELFERQLGHARQEIRHKRVRLDVLRLEADRLSEDAEQWSQIANRESRTEIERRAHRKLIEKSRGIVALRYLSEKLERDLSTLEPKVIEDGAAVSELRQRLRMLRGETA